MRKRVKWPGLAAVIVSVVQVMKEAFSGQRRLDDRTVETITAFLFHRGGHDDPAGLAANNSKSLVGNYVLGMGFTFDDTHTKGVATPLVEMQRLIEKDPHNREVIFPYIGGEEINTSASHAHRRYVIDFGDRSEAECWRRWPDLQAIVEAKVKPERMLVKRKALRERWWQFAEKQPALQAAIARLERVLVVSQTTKHFGFVFLPTGMVYSHKTIVFPFDSHSVFATLQCSLHAWSKFFGSTLEDRPVYTPSDCFETFPSRRIGRPTQP